MLKNITNGKVYIGQTVLESYGPRRNRHFRDLRTQSHGNSHLQNAWDNSQHFVFGVIEKCDSIKELNEREVYWITHYQSLDKRKGYNKRSGGDNEFMTDDTIELMRKVKAENRGLRVSQYTKDGELVATYPSIREAARQTGAHEFSIRRVLNPDRPKCKTAGGYVWKLI